MKNLKKIFFIFLILVLVFIIYRNISAHENTTIVEANIIGFANETFIPDVSIIVPDHIFLGNVTKDKPVSDEITIYINNTGRLPITVTPQLKDSEEIIFSYLFFRTLKTTSTNDSGVIPKRIGNFSMNIDKPAPGSNNRGKRFYIQLNLTDFKGEIKEDLIGYKSEIIFLAMPQ
ncbi:MAG: hypothetical protein QXW97_00940 [Candidatus Pacearchaeota archaeon]